MPSGTASTIRRHISSLAFNSKFNWNSITGGPWRGGWEGVIRRQSGWPVCVQKRTTRPVVSIATAAQAPFGIFLRGKAGVGGAARVGPVQTRTADLYRVKAKRGFPTQWMNLQATDFVESTPTDVGSEMELFVGA